MGLSLHLVPGLADVRAPRSAIRAGSMDASTCVPIAGRWPLLDELPRALVWGPPGDGGDSTWSSGAAYRPWSAMCSTT